MASTVKDRFFAVLGILVIVIVGGWLTLTQLKATLEQPGVFYVIQDRLADIGELNVSTRSSTYVQDGSVLSWRYGVGGMTLYKNSSVLVKSQWDVTGFSLKKTHGSDRISYAGDQNEQIVVVALQIFYSNGVFNEKTTVDPRASAENFPSEHFVTWEPTNNYKHSLTWRLSNLDFPSSIQHGRYYKCELSTKNFVKINWCKETSKLNYAFVDLKKKTLTIYFNSVKGSQALQVSVVDPPLYFGNGWKFEQRLDLNTSGIGLTGNVTRDHGISVRVKSNNTDFWNNIQSAGQDVRFSNCTKDTAYTYHFEDFNSILDDANTWVNMTDTYTSASNSCAYIYFGNSSALDAQNETGTYGSDYNVVWHLDESSGDAQDSTSNNIDLTHNNTPTLNANAQIDGGVSYLSTSSEYSSNATFFDAAVGDISYLMWFKLNGAGGFSSTAPDTDFNGLMSKSNVADSDQPVRLRFNPITGAIDCVIKVNTSTATASTIQTSWTSGIWYHVVCTRVNDTGVVNVYANAVIGSSGSSTAGNVAAGTHEDFRVAQGSGDVIYLNGIVDEAKVYGAVLTANDINIIYNSEADRFVTFNTSSTRDANILYPDASGQKLYIYENIGVPNILDVNVLASDGNSSSAVDVLFDFNHSASAGGVGSAVAILTDGNVATTPRLSCDNNNFSTYRVCSYEWRPTESDLNAYSNRFLNTRLTKSSLDSNDSSSNSFDVNRMKYVVTIRDPDGNTNVARGYNLNIVFDVNQYNLPDFNWSTRSFVNFLFDINYSSNATQGTGTQIINNGSVASTPGLSCDTNKMEKAGDIFGTTCTYVWSVPTTLTDTTHLIVDVQSDVVVKHNRNNTNYTIARSDTTDTGINFAAIHKDVNVVYPNDANVVLLRGGNADLNFNMYSTDVTSAAGFLIDLNYSRFNTVGTGTVIIQDGNVATTPNLRCDSNVISTAKQCTYKWTVPQNNGEHYLLVAMKFGGEQDFDASDNTFTYYDGVRFGNVLENYLTDLNKAQYFPKALVDTNVEPFGQDSSNGFWQLNNIEGGSSSGAVILLNKRTLFDFESNWVDWKRQPTTDALLAMSNTDSFQGVYSMALRVDKDLNFSDNNRLAVWTNNQFTHDVNADYNVSLASFRVYIRASDVSQIEDINMVIGNDASNYASWDINQLKDSNMTSGEWFKWDMNKVNAINVGNVNWKDLNYVSVRVLERVNATNDFNVLLDDLSVRPTSTPLINWDSGTGLCVDTDNSIAGCLDVNSSSAAIVVPSLSQGSTQKVWVWLDINALGYTPYTIFDFDLNWGLGTTPTST